MLKIEVIKFEAQDVITASTAAPAEPKCICDQATGDNGHLGSGTGTHYVGNQICPYPHKEGDCEIN